MRKNLNNISTIELSYKPNFKLREKPKVNSTDDVYYVLMNHWNHNTIHLIEEFKIVLFNCQSVVLGVMTVATGGITHVMVDPKLIFAAAVTSGATGILLAHNHPSGDLTPSIPDKQLTKRIIKLAELHQITVLDHLIVNSEDYFSFVEANLIVANKETGLIEMKG
ncbi:DNA repair protein [Pedobacter sp. BAL39]|uniref:JAB domain-containing protein n=1 Tax=Pedobacter sp. BAL39 TaxID=391596 RepID=UPI000155A800|nr:JAB domain-containing protein [Pedobacter sp. BAL39]EDM33946.1 DNA repair protein [Pedobacter sp. BAL39]